MLRWTVQSELERFAANGTSLEKFLEIDQLENDLNSEEKSQILNLINSRNLERKKKLLKISNSIKNSLVISHSNPFQAAFIQTNLLNSTLFFDSFDFQLVFNYFAAVYIYEFYKNSSQIFISPLSFYNQQLDPKRSIYNDLVQLQAANDAFLDLSAPGTDTMSLAGSTLAYRRLMERVNNKYMLSWDGEVDFSVIGVVGDIGDDDTNINDTDDTNDDDTNDTNNTIDHTNNTINHTNVTNPGVSLFTYAAATKFYQRHEIKLALITNSPSPLPNDPYFAHITSLLTNPPSQLFTDDSSYLSSINSSISIQKSQIPTILNDPLYKILLGNVEINIPTLNFDPPINIEIDDNPPDDNINIPNLLGLTNPLSLISNFAFALLVATALSILSIIAPYLIGGCFYLTFGLVFAAFLDTLIFAGNRIADICLNTPPSPFALPLAWKFFKHSHSQKNTLAIAAYTLLGFSIVVAIGYFIAYHAPRLSKTTAGRRAEIMLLQNLRLIGLFFKVLAIAAIELFFFPVMCGALLTIALLPLSSFSPSSILECFLNYPLLSPIVFWALGIAYMFQFAMFVSMSRSIIRPGVLYFVRDPNDPNIHPIGDIMERPALPQLKKIALSAIIYAALILVCIGAVLYTLRNAFHLFFFPLSFDWLQSPPPLFWLASWALFCVLVYTLALIDTTQLFRNAWTRVFHSACHALRLSFFILNKPVAKEQGSWVYPSWSAWITRKQPVFVPDGYYVRAPNADNVVIKGLRLFEPVDKEGKFTNDTNTDNTDTTTNDNLPYTIVYRPPHFRLRVAGLLAVIWIVAGLAVFSVTGYPALLGRSILAIIGTPRSVVVCWAAGFAPASLSLLALFTASRPTTFPNPTSFAKVALFYGYLLAFFAQRIAPLPHVAHLVFAAHALVYTLSLVRNFWYSRIIRDAETTPFRARDSVLAAACASCLVAESISARVLPFDPKMVVGAVLWAAAAVAVLAKGVVMGIGKVRDTAYLERVRLENM